MKPRLPKLKTLASFASKDKTGNHEEIEAAVEPAAEPKPPPPLSLFFMLSHLEDDGPVRLDGVKLAVCEVMGLETGRTQAGGLRRGAERPGLPGATAGAPAPAGAARIEGHANRGPARRPA